MNKESKSSILTTIAVAIVLLAVVFQAGDIIRGAVARHQSQTEKEKETFHFHVDYRAVSETTKEVIPSIIQIAVNGPDYYSRLDESIAGQSRAPFTVTVNVYGLGGEDEFLKSIEHTIDEGFVGHYDIPIEGTNQTQ